MLYASGPVLISNMVCSMFDLEYSSRLYMVQDHKVLMVQDHMALDHMFQDHIIGPKSHKTFIFTLASQFIRT